MFSRANKLTIRREFFLRSMPLLSTHFVYYSRNFPVNIKCQSFQYTVKQTSKLCKLTLSFIYSLNGVMKVNK